MSSKASGNTPLRLALIGAGMFASTGHFSVLSELQSKNVVQVRVVWSRRASSASELAARYGSHVSVQHAESTGIDHDCKKHPDIDDHSALASAKETLRKYRTEIDAVVIAVPIPQNAAYTKLALGEGLHTLCEKPLAHDIQTAISLLTDPEISASPALHAVGENFRFEPAFLRAKQLAKSCGQVIALRLIAQMPMPSGSRYARGWRLQLPHAGILVDGFVHQIAALRTLAGSDVKFVDARCASHAAHFAGTDTVSATLIFDNDIRASVFATYASAVFRWELAFVGTLADIILKRLPGKPGYQISLQNMEGVQSDEFLPFAGIDEEFVAFVESCSSRVLHPHLHAHAAFNDLATVHSMFQSSEENHPVQVPPVPSP